MASTDARPVPQKNVAFRVTFPILDSTGSLVTGATGLDSEVSKDGGTFADCTNEATEIATSSGVYYLDLTSTEMNADTVAVIVKTSSSGAKTTTLVMYPEEAGDIRVNVTQMAADTVTASALATDAVTEIQSGLATAANLSTVAGYLDTEVAAILADTNELQTDWVNGGRLDLLIDAIKAKTDTITAAPSASTIAEAVMESRLEASYDTTAVPAATLRRRLRQMFAKVGL